MLSLINSLLFRIKKTPLFWILLAICVGLPILSALMNAGANDMINDIIGGIEGGGDIGDIGLVESDFLTIGGALVNISSNLSILVIVGVAVFIGNEYSFGTIRNAVLSNKSRNQLYFAYAIVATIFAVALTTAYLLSTYVSNLIAFGAGNYKTGEILLSVFVTYGLAVLVNIFIAALTLFFVIWTRKKSSSIIFPLLITIVLSGLIFTIILVMYMLGQYTLEQVGWIPLANYYFYSMFGGVPDGTLSLQIFATTAAMTIIFGALGWLLMRKRDLN